jgi:DNA-binding CsgD family transcriptional regulator
MTASTAHIDRARARYERILDLWAQGLDRKTISTRLGVSPHTITATLRKARDILDPRSDRRNTA